MNNSNEPPNARTQQINPASATAIPEIGFGSILGLLQVLKSHGGREDIYKLGAELKMEFGDLLSVIRAAELLKLVHTPGGDVVLEPLGEKVCKAGIPERKELIRREMENLPVIRKVKEFLFQQEGKEAEREKIQELLAELLPNEDVEVSFNNLVSWARYADLFAYNDDTHILYIDTENEEED